MLMAIFGGRENMIESPPLNDLFDWAGQCVDFDAFRARLSS